MLKLPRKALQLLVRRDVLRVYQLLAMSVVVASVEVLGIGSIAPFVAVLTSPELIETNPYLRRAYAHFQFTDPNDFLLLLAGVVIVLALTRNVLFVVHQWLNLHYVMLFKHNLSSRLLRAYLAQPYDYFLTRSSLDMQRNVVQDSYRVIDGVLRPVIDALMQLITCTAIVLFLVIVSPVVALATLTVLGGFYLVIYFLVNRRLAALSVSRHEYRRSGYKLASEALSGIKPLILTGQQRGYADEFERVSRLNAVAEAKGRAIAAIPRYGIESIAIIGLVLFAIYKIGISDQGVTVLPLIALYLLAGYRLLPALQGVYANISSIQFDSASLDVIYRHFTTLDHSIPATAPDTGFRFKARIDVSDVTHYYANQGSPALSDINLSIEAKQAVAFVGKTGAGKSTLVDLILGLLEPVSGQIRIDGQPLGEVKSAWHGQIGYVPQHIYLADDTVARNIAFGVDPQDIDQAAVVRAAKIADVHDHVTTRLASAYETVIGERGISLSGGQRQRIGIARALYRNPGILVLDEATSALDSATENVVMEAIQKLSNDVTIILIAHRMTTVQSCDRIFVLTDGQITGQGDYASLAADSAAFRELNALLP